VNHIQPLLLVRKELATRYELGFAEKYFPVEESRMNCRNRLVIGRYSVLPYYDELDRDLRLIGSRLINSWDEHRWITTFDYYSELQAFTPETWDDGTIHLCRHKGPFVVKGKMSSRKHHWKTHMFAPTREAALDLAARLKEDTDIREQGVVYRKYVPLKTYEIGHNGLPYTNEWRFFFLKDRLLSKGYYWSMGDCVGRAEFHPRASALAAEIARIASRFTTFFTMDLAETADGDWILIELNDAQTAAPSENNLDELYGNLREAFTR
jgi:hypothetical protein